MESNDSGGNSAAAVSSGPATFAEAFASDASPAPEPSAQSETPAAAVSPQVANEAPTPATGDERSPFIPRPRFDEVNTKYNEAKQKLEALSWAEQVDRRAVEQAVQLSQLYNTDRAGYIRQLMAESMSDPAMAPLIRSEAARFLGTRTQPSPDQEPQLESIPVQLEDGRVVQLVTAESQAKREAWMRQQIQSQMEQKFQPAMQTAEQFRALQEHAKRQAEAGQFAQSFGGDFAKLPHFAELKGEIHTRLSQATLQSDHPAEVRAAAYQIYIETLAEKVLPTLSQKAQSQLLDNLQQKAAASTTVNPGSAASATPRSPKSFHDKDLQW